MQNILKQPLSDDELNELHIFLSSEYKDAKQMSLTKVHGFLTAIVSAPSLIMPSKWHPLLFGGDPNFESMEKAMKIITLVDRLHNSINDALRNNDQFDISFFKEGKIIPSQQASSDLIAEWCNGYLAGAELDDFWLKDREAINTIHPFAILANKVSNLEDCIDDDGNFIEDEALEKNKMWEKLPRYIKELHSKWTKHRGKIIGKAHYIRHENADDVKPIEPYRRKTVRISRNDPCHCDSGKKYKKCCLETKKPLH
jgi:uncharacterized protein